MDSKVGIFEHKKSSKGEIPSNGEIFPNRGGDTASTWVQKHQEHSGDA